MVGAELSVSTGLSGPVGPSYLGKRRIFFLPGPLSPPPDIPVWVSVWVKLALRRHSGPGALSKSPCPTPLNGGEMNKQDEEQQIKNCGSHLSIICRLESVFTRKNSTGSRTDCPAPRA